jgi:formylglycine-generating enzyme required for sulfatase activity
LAVATSPAVAQPDPSGIDFVTIGSPGNAPWTGDGTVGDRAVGRGGVDYTYKIGRFEVTTAQWAEFMNAALDRPSNDHIPHVFAPSQWGAVGTTPNNPGGLRFAVPAGREMLPAGGVDWRTAAIFCNWLCNDKGTDRSSFMNGAYDVSTFGYQGTIFTDQFVHNPGARYYIPSFDEWLKAAHYDPNRFGQGQGGWWLLSNATNTRLNYGPPGVHVRANPPPQGPDPNGPIAQANGGWEGVQFPGYDPYAVPLGAYPGTQSPWGLLDVAGGTSEWTEGISYTNDTFPTGRIFDGSGWVSGSPPLDQLYFRSSESPSIGLSNLGFRVAAAIPSPPTCGVMGLMLVSSALRRRREGGPHEEVWNSGQGG